MPYYPETGKEMLEKKIEERLRKKAKEAGGLAAKWVSPSMSGVPVQLTLLVAVAAVEPLSFVTSMSHH